MSVRSKKEYPYKVITLIPKGAKIGSKKRDIIRCSYHRSIEKAQSEVQNWLSVGFNSHYTKR